MLENACGVPGSVWHNSDDSYTIFIDASLSSSHQKKVFEHEMRHIFENDFEKSNMQEIEKAAHK